MRGFVLTSMFLAVLVFVENRSQAGSAHGRPCDCPAPCQPAVCSKPCEAPIAYEERTITVYDVKYREVTEEKVVKGTKFVADTEQRDVTTTCMEERVPPCGPVNTCGPASCCVEKVPVTCIRKGTFPIVREVPSEEKIKVTHIVEERTPRTIVCRVPKAPPCPPPCVCDPAKAAR